jgi:hypothetical protein
MSYYPINEGEVHMYKQLEKKVPADKAKHEAEVIDLKDALGMSGPEGP